MRSLGYAFVLGLIGASIHATDARAESWPVGRHDAARTGASTGSVPISEPFVTWRAYMGGAPTAATVEFGIQNSSTLIASVGGRFIVKDALTQATLWKSEMLGVGFVEAIADLDGDQNSEIIVRTETRAVVLDGKTGSALWSSASDAFQTPSAIRVVDMDGNGLPDVYVDECTTCAKKGTMSAGAYSFANGFAVPITLWERPLSVAPIPKNSGTDAIVDLDEDGIPEVVLAAGDKIVVVKGSTGATIATLALSTNDPNPFPHTRAIAANIDGLPGKELVMIQSTGQVATQGGPAGVTVFRLDPKTGTNSMLYRRVAANFDAAMVTQSDVVSDLDGDGVAEVIFSYRGASNSVFKTEVYSGAGGTLVSSFDNARFEGAANLDGQPGDEIILATQNGLSIHSLVGGQFTAIAGPIPELRVQRMPDAFGRRTGQIEYRAGVLERPGKLPALLVGKPSTQIAYADLPDVWSFLDIRGMAMGSAGLETAGIYVPLAGEITGVMPAGGATRPYPQIAIGTTVGTVVLLSQSFQGTNGVVYAGGQATGTLVGGAMQPNTGAYGGPLIDQDEEGPFVVMPGGPLGLAVSDARWASLIVPPVDRWTAPIGAASIVHLGSMGPVLVAADGQSLVAKHTLNGTTLAQVNLGFGAPRGTPLPLNVAGSNTPLVGIDWQVEGVQIVQHAVDFTTQSEVWQGKPLPYGGFFASGVADLDNDGTDEWYSMNTGLNRRDALTGDTLTVSGEDMGYTLPMVASFQPGNAKQLLLQGGGVAPRLLDGNLKQVWQAPATEAVNGMGGTRVECGSSVRFVSPAVLSPMLRAFDGQTGALVAERALAGGSAYPTLAQASAAGKRPGVLSNASSTAQLGNGNGAIFVGSSDGYLYAVDACSLDLRWSIFLGGSVAEPIIGDTDGDVGNEVVVGVADGTIVNIDVPAVTPIPTDGITFVGPKNGQAPIVVSPGESVTIAFSSVQGATSYEYALVSPEERALWSPAFLETKSNQISVDLKGALAARPYKVAIRAKGPAGVSPEAFSPNIVIDDHNAPTLEAKASESGKTLELSLSMRDDLALDHWIVWMRDADVSDAPNLVAGEALVGGASSDVTANVVAPKELYGKNVAIRVDVLDSAGNAAQSMFTAKVDPNGQIVSLVAPNSDKPISFGGCSTSNSSSTNSGAALFVALVMAMTRRIRRRA